jgi:hypothetical protein
MPVQRRRPSWLPAVASYTTCAYCGTVVAETFVDVARNPNATTTTTATAIRRDEVPMLCLPWSKNFFGDGVASDET